MCKYACFDLKHKLNRKIQCGFSPRWLSICIFKWQSNLDHLSYNFELPLWQLTVCYCRCVAGLNIFPHWSQIKPKVFVPSMARMCVFNNAVCLNYFWQRAHFVNIVHVINVEKIWKWKKHIRSHMHKKHQLINTGEMHLVCLDLNAGFLLVKTPGFWLDEKEGLA